MVADIVTDIHFFNFAVFCQFCKDILVEQIKVLLQLLAAKVISREVVGVLVNVGEQQCLREDWLDMFP